MRNVFSDTALESEFQQQGFVVVPFLAKDEVKQLKQAFFDGLPQSGGHLGPEDENVKTKQAITYDFTFIDKNSDYKQQVFDTITAAFDTHTNRYLDRYIPIIANFIRKKTDDGEVPLHQNWAFLDEKLGTSVSIWCPLVDSNEENGTLQVVPGSHKRFGAVRGPMIRSELEDIKHGIIEQHLQPINIKAGEAVILDDSIVHYSAINKTDDLRLAIQLILLPQEIPSIHYHMDHSKSREHVEVLEVDRAFYMTFNPWKKPAADIKRIHDFAYTPFSLTLEEFNQGLQNDRFDSKPAIAGIWGKFKSLLGA